MPERVLRASLAWAILALLSVPRAVPAAGIAVGHIGSRTGEAVEPAWHAAFRTGAEEVGGNKPTTPSLAEVAPARLALQKGEDEYLKARLRAAEKLLVQAADAFLGSPAALDADVVTHALILLAEVQLANGRSAAAEKTLERGLLNVPDFPGPVGALPPEVATLQARVSTRTQAQITGHLEVTADVPGVTVFVAGRPLGEAPLQRGGLPPRALAVRLVATGEPPMERVIDFAAGPGVLHWASSEARRAALAAAAVRGDEAALMAAGADLETAIGADTSCVALIEDEGHVVVIRFAGRAGQILAGQRVPPPDAVGGWRALGRFCGPGAAANLDAAAATRRLRPPPEAVRSADGLSSRTWIALSLLGLGVGAGGAGRIGST